MVKVKICLKADENFIYGMSNEWVEKMCNNCNDIFQCMLENKRHINREKYKETK